MTRRSPPGVLLVNPPITRAQRRGPLGPVIKNLYFNSPPLGIAYIAAALERDGFKAGLMDAAVEDFSVEETIDRIRAAAPDVVGITSTTNFFCNAVDLAEGLKQALPSTTIVLGGPHASSNPEQAMDVPWFDFACRGEGEITASELVAALRDGSPLDAVRGIVYRAGGSLRHAPPRPLVENLDDLPMPARHLLPLDKYVPQPNDGPFLPKAAMISSRGCPHQCIFCDHATYGYSYRSFSAGRIVDEMEQLVRTYGIRDIAFVDSLFMVNRQRVAGIVDEIERRGLRVHWTCTIRANIATRDVLERMKRAGCWRVRIGVEAGDPGILELIRKHVTREEVRRVVTDADDLRLHPKGFFMIGHPGETRGKIRETIRFACSLPLTDVTVQVNTPLPGTPQWDMIGEYGTLISRDLKKYSFWEPVFVPRGMRESDLLELHGEFYRRFYLRPVVIWRHLRMIRRFSDVRRYLRALALMVNMFIKKRKDAPPAGAAADDTPASHG